MALRPPLINCPALGLDKRVAQFRFPFLRMLGSYVSRHAVFLPIVVDVFSAIETSVLDSLQQFFVLLHLALIRGYVLFVLGYLRYEILGLFLQEYL